MFAKQSCLLLLACAVFFSCDKTARPAAPSSYLVSGKVEKGPFVQGSTMSMATVNDRLEATGKTYSATITDDAGSFSFGSQEFDSRYAKLTANGYYFNEVRGELSSGPLTLSALVDLSDKNSVNVNILTHLAAVRLQKLIVTDKKQFSEAYSQAQNELLSEFGFPQFADEDPSQFSISSGTDEAAALIVISCLLQMDRSEAQITEYLSRIAMDFADDGRFSPQIHEQISADRNILYRGLPYIAENIVRRYSELGTYVSVKDLSSVVDWDGDGLIGNETLKDGEKVILSQDSIRVPAEGGTYMVTIDSPVPVYLESPVSSEGSQEVPPSIPVLESIQLYEGDFNSSVSYEARIDGNVLTITVAPIGGRMGAEAEIPVYVFSGEQAASVRLSQEGAGSGELPLLSHDGQIIMNSLMEAVSRAVTMANEGDAIYTGLRSFNGFTAPLDPGSANVHNLWSYYYSAIRLLNSIRDYDSSNLNVYGPYFDIYTAILYYNMAVSWGDIPYIVSNALTDGGRVMRTPVSTIWGKLEKNLTEAVGYAEEKANTALATDMNDALFLSKDVARILLADIYMYQGRYSDAAPLLQKVFDNGFYRTETPLQPADRSGDAILALFRIDGTKASITEGGYTWIFCMTDVVLSLSECCNMLGDTARARKLFNIVGRGINGGEREGTIEDIKNARAALMLPGFFAFLKRNGLAESVAGLEPYQLLWPIPSRELDMNPVLTQNPGY